MFNCSIGKAIPSWNKDTPDVASGTTVVIDVSCEDKKPISPPCAHTDSNRLDESDMLEPPKSQSRICSVRKVCGLLGLIALICMSHPFLMVTLFFASGSLRGSSGLFLIACISITIHAVLLLLPGMCYQCYHFFRSQELLDWKTCYGCLPKGLMSCRGVVFQRGLPVVHGKSFKAILFSKAFLCIYGALSVLLLTEIVLLILYPMESIFPLGLGAEDALAAGPEAECNFQWHWSKASAYFAHSGIDFSKVRVVVGGAPAILRQAPAQVFDNTIYLRDFCIPWWVLTHELVHTWQFQSGWFFEEGAGTLWSMAVGYIRCYKCMYDYGGRAGLAAALEKDSKAPITTFGAEQQAEIVRHYLELRHMRSNFVHESASQDNCTLGTQAMLENPAFALIATAYGLFDYYHDAGMFALQILHLPRVAANETLEELCMYVAAHS